MIDEPPAAACGTAVAPHGQLLSELPRGRVEALPYFRPARASSSSMMLVKTPIGCAPVTTRPLM